MTILAQRQERPEATAASWSKTRADPLGQPARCSSRPRCSTMKNRAIFDKCWVYVGHASGNPQTPATSAPASVAGRPIIFCRDRRSTPRALINSCRHRGAIVCREREGNARQFYCMYHGWTYHTDGKLKGDPGRRRLRRILDKPTRGLVEVPLEHLSRLLFPQLRSRRARPRHLSGRRQGTTSTWWSNSRRRGAWKSSPACRNTTSRRTGSSWSRTASTTIISSRRIRPGSTTCATRASMSRVPKGTVAADQRHRQGSRQRSSDHRQSEFPRPAGCQMDFDLRRRSESRYRRHPQRNSSRVWAKRVPPAWPTPTAISSCSQSRDQLTAHP